MPDNVIQVVNDTGEQNGTANGIQFCNIHHKSTLVDLFADDDHHNDDSNTSDTDSDLSEKPEEDLKKITFDNHIDDNEVEDLNIDNKDIRHLNDGDYLSCNIGVQHEQEVQHNHSGGPIVDKHQQNRSILRP